MKNTLKSSLLACAAFATLSASSPASLLFQENWSDLEAGESAVSSGRWSVTQGLATQIVKAAPPSLAGDWIAPVYTTSDGSSVLPQIQTTESFTLSQEGVEFSINAVFTNNTSQYFRVGLVAADNALQNYWFTIHRNEVQLHKRNGVALPTKLAFHTFNTGEWVLNEPRDFSLRIIPVDGSYQLNVLLNGVSVISFSDTSGLPDFTNGFHLFLAARDNQQGYLGSMTLQSIPEGQSIALIASGFLLTAPLLRGKRAKLLR